MTSSLCTCPWQIYLFAFTYLAMALCMLYMGLIDGRICSFIFVPGDGVACNAVEQLCSSLVGISGLYIFAFFFMLAYGNKGKEPELKRLAVYTTCCAVATFCGVVCFGSSAMAGVEKSVIHKLDMIYAFALFAVLLSVTYDGEGPMAESTSPWTGLKWLNPKVLVLVIAIVLTVKIFVFSDFIDMFGYMLTEEQQHEATDLAEGMRIFMMICMFEILLATIFALVHGNSKDHEYFVDVVMVLMVGTMFIILPFSSHLRDGIIMQSFASLGVFLIACIFSVFQSRRERREGYSAV